MVFASRAFIVGARWRIGADDQEIGTRGETLVAGAGGKDGNIRARDHARATLAA